MIARTTERENLAEVFLPGGRRNWPRAENRPTLMKAMGIQLDTGNYRKSPKQPNLPKRASNMQSAGVNPNKIEEKNRLPRMTKAAAGVTVHAASRAGATSRWGSATWSTNGSGSRRRPAPVTHEKKPAQRALPSDYDLSGATAQGKEGQTDEMASGSNGPGTPRQ